LNNTEKNDQTNSLLRLSAKLEKYTKELLKGLEKETVFWRYKPKFSIIWKNHFGRKERRSH